MGNNNGYGKQNNPFAWICAFSGIVLFFLVLIGVLPLNVISIIAMAILAILTIFLFTN